MATHSSILAWKIPQTREAWQTTVPGVAKESDTTEQLNNSRKDLTSKHGSMRRLYRLRLRTYAFSGRRGESDSSARSTGWQFFSEGVVVAIIYPSVGF